MPKPRRGRLPAFPTIFLPGTAEKVDVMAQRAARGERLFHPDDAKMDEPRLVRARVMNDLGNRRKRWDVDDERDYRARHPCDRFYGGTEEELD